MHSANHGDYGPVTAAIIFALISLVPLFDIKGFCSYMGRRVITRSRLHRGLNEPFGYWSIRASGVCGLIVAAIMIFVA